MQKRLSHYWEIFIRYIWWIVFVAIFNGLQYLQSIREELPPNWQGVLKVMNIFPGWNPVVWITIFFFIALFIILESAHQRISLIEDEFQAYKHEPPQMIELGKLHTNGVVLRNRGTRIKKENFKEDFPVWQQEYEEWKRQVVSVISQISASKAQRIETLSTSANLSDGQAAAFTESDIRVFALIYYYWEDTPDIEHMRTLLNQEHHLEDMFVEFAYLNTPIFQEPPEELDGTWTHGILINGMALRRHLDIARAYKTAGDALVEQALLNYPPYELDYPIFFTYRHAIELYLKIIVDYAFAPERERKPHSLKGLITKLQEKYDASLPDWMEARIADFEEIDPKSTSFRYAEAMPNNVKNEELWIDLHQLKVVMHTLCDNFEKIIHKIYTSGTAQHL